MVVCGWILRSFGCLALLGTIGCGPSVELGTVTGTVTEDGEPADSILVNFMPDPSSDTPGAMSSGITDDAGRFELTYEADDRPKGAVVGTHRVVLNDLAPENFRGNGPPPKSRVEPDWMNAGRTPYRVDVQAGDQSIEIKLGEW